MEEQSSYHPNTRLKGVTAVNGLVMGVVKNYSRGNININSVPIEAQQVPEEIRKFQQARKSVSSEIERLSDFASGKDDADTIDILDAQNQILRDPELKKTIESMIDQHHLRAEKAVYDAFQVYIELIKSSDNSFLVTRLSDLREVRDRLVQNVQQLAAIAGFGKDTIMVAEDVSPLEVVTFARSGVKGIICNLGGLTSHASIIANAMGIPMIIDTKVITRVARDGDIVILNGYDDQIILRPDQKTERAYIRSIKEHREEEKQLRYIIDKPAVTRCGQEISLQANIDFEEEILSIKKFRAEGIGLLRTDTLLMNSGPVSMDRKRQESFCKAAFSGSGSAPVTIRLLDVGGDKVLDFKTNEANPFLGWRGIRILLDRRELLRSQLEVICRVAGQHPGRTRILTPMITILDEFLMVKNELERMKEQLSNKGVPVDRDIRIGVMVEVPSVALQTPKFARHVDFFSIGTNDLTQYTMAVDRGNNLISSLYQPLHPSVLSLIEMTVKAGRRSGVPVAVCGELAWNPFAALILVGLGVYELSMTPRLIPKVKQAIRLHTVKEMKSLARKMLRSSSGEETAEIKKNWMSRFEKKLKEERIRPLE